MANIPTGARRGLPELVTTLHLPPTAPRRIRRRPVSHPGATVPMFDFDRVIDRRGTHASKWDMMTKLSGIPSSDGIPMWVADMDFAAPPGVTDALNTAVTRGVHGY